MFRVGGVLADVLEASTDQLVDDLDRRAWFFGSTELGVAGRRTRLKALVQEIVAALRSNEIGDEVQPPPPSSDPRLDLEERELVRRYLIDRIEHEHLNATCEETVVVVEWASRVERTRLRDQVEWLSTLLDDVEDGALILAPDGKILYCNLRASQRLHEVVGVKQGDIIGRTPAELGVSNELVVGRPIDEMVTMARAHESFEMTAWGRESEGTFEAIYRRDGSVGAVALRLRDIHARKLAQTRLEMLTKLSALVGVSEIDDVTVALTHVAIPQFADWCAVSFGDSARIHSAFVAHRNPADTPLRNAIMRAIPSWDRHPLWRELLPGGFQLLSNVTDDLLRRLAVSDEQYRLLLQIGVRSVIVVPLVTRGQVAGIVICAYTKESGRRYGRDDPALAEELALHAAHAFENARLMKDLKASEARFRIALAGARTSVYEQDTALRYVWYYSPFMRHDVLGKTTEESFPPDEAAQLTALKRRVLDEGETVQAEMDRTLGGDERGHFRETMAPLRDRSGRITGVIGASTDITEQQRTQQQLTEAIGFRERMMGILGHDLRSPISAITLAGDLLLRRHGLPAPAREHVLRIRRSAGRMKEMIDTLLDFTRPEVSWERCRYAPVPADLGRHLTRHGRRDARRMARPSDRPGTCTANLHGEWDPERMSQTIANLLGQRDRSRRDRAPVPRSRSTARTPTWKLKVHNDGQPIPANLMPVLFKQFRRGAVHDRCRTGSGWGSHRRTDRAARTKARSASSRRRRPARRHGAPAAHASRRRKWVHCATRDRYRREPDVEELPARSAVGDQSAAAAGVHTLVVTGTSLAGSRAAADLAGQTWPAALHATAGVHPHHAVEATGDWLAALRALAGRARVVAVGECGLDFNRNYSPQADRIRYFARPARAGRRARPTPCSCRRDAQTLHRHPARTPTVAARRGGSLLHRHAGAPGGLPARWTCISASRAGSATNGAGVSRPPCARHPAGA